MTSKRNTVLANPPRVSGWDVPRVPPRLYLHGARKKKGMCYYILVGFGLWFLVSLVVVLALCKAAGEADDQTEEWHRDWQRQKEEEKRNASYKEWNLRGYRQPPHRN